MVRHAFSLPVLIWIHLWTFHDSLCRVDSIFMKEWLNEKKQ